MEQHEDAIFTYKISGAAGPMHYEVGHVSNDVRCESQIKQHVKDVK